MLQSREQVLAYTKQLVQIESIVNTEGEKVIAHSLHTLIASMPYFQKHYDQVLLEKTVDDAQDRFNVLAFVKGTKAPSNRTVILMGHIDTVGTNDYDELQSLAYNPEKLKEALKEEPLAEHVKEHVHSDNWMFGRGVLDMKSGLASHLFLLHYYSENPHLLEGNIVFVGECDEEDGSNGILTAVSTLNKWKEEYGFQYVGAVNADFVSPRYADDPNRYIYQGTVGKLLPSFFITGAETHVGSAFEGLDPNFIAAELTRAINYNPALCDESLGETTVPPVSLKQMDLKPSYDVQTALSAYVYYNFFIHSWTPKMVLDKLCAIAEDAFTNALESLQQRYEAYAKLSGQPANPLPWKSNVMTYEQLEQQLVDLHGDTYRTHMEEFKAALMEREDLDTRMYAARVVEEAWRWMPEKQPTIIAFYSSLYSPRIEISGKTNEEKRLLEGVKKAVETVQPSYAYPIVTRNFFPYISDMSFVAISDNEEGIRAANVNNPSFGTKLRVNYEEIRALNVPVINIGPYGVDAHKKLERMEMTYSLEVVPNLTNEVVQYVLSSD
ncbi:M20/M25/M40 family metallo-hydrolase [Mangrovibacillus cuniculi]|uniref:M20/M25/M40 family metallo-hydrolase n=1 Tax=Mangrovibacillus cuniculi TaxID=2593652 RepID=A0A7S8CD55_9BACI|nr:M20/M25/M40 family metallo-hydrolase [Mangrovibacillus cuniculi]QPC47821.1 M20/M25/M40 family metallo-hydrolase [Mangrovibacillus cuniculi]